jgi:hypothetical protein
VNTQTPLSISETIIKHARRVVPGGAPEFIPVTPFPGKTAHECFSNVENHVKAAGGYVQFGWYIYLWPRVLLEFVFHAVWRQTNGKLVDLTPHPDNEPEILFLPDPSRAYEGLSLDNVRFPLTKKPLVQRYIELAEQRFYEFNKNKTPYVKMRKVNGIALVTPGQKYETASIVRPC